MRVIVCGSGTWKDRDAVRVILHGLIRVHGELTVIHGGCLSGADLHVARLAAQADSVTVEAYPANWDLHGKYAGPLRNRLMADSGADLCVAFTDMPATEGTAHMIRCAKRVGIPVLQVSHP